MARSTRIKSKCSVEGCTRPHLARGWCHVHYRRWKATGDPTRTKMTERGLPMKWLLEYLSEGGKNNECKEWPFAIGGGGYGNLRFEGRSITANRFVCLHSYGTPPEGRNHSAHSCGNPKCVNPGHLRWASTAENINDRPAHGTDTRGQKCWNSKLSSDDVLAIRRCLAEGESNRNLAERYGVAQVTIAHIKRRSRWAWL